MGKVTIIGTGNVGATAALHVAEFAEVVLIDIAEGIPQGKALDLRQAGCVQGKNIVVSGDQSYEQTANSDVIVVTAGMARSGKKTREEMLATNARIVESVVREAVAQSPTAVIIMVSNPLDIMCSVAQRASGFSRERIIGMAGALDTARYTYNIATAADVSPSEVNCMVIGSHSDLMVPLVSTTTISGKPLNSVLDAGTITEIREHTRKGGQEIVDMLGVSAYYAPGKCIAKMVRAVLDDTGEIIPCSVIVEGEYGFSGISIGLPAKLGAGGVQEIVQIELSPEEKEELQRCASFIENLTTQPG